MASTELKLQIVLPLAGRSHRFKVEGVNTPKPVLAVLGKPMVQYALESIEPLLVNSRLVAIVCAEDEIRAPVEKILRKFSSQATVEEIPHRTAGPVQTVLSVQSLLNVNEPLLILDGDICFQAPAFITALSNPGGHLLTFPSQDPAFSYAQTNEVNKVLAVAEKKIISKFALMGAYHFPTAGEFLRSAQKLVQNNPSKEHYISHVIADLLESGAGFTAIRCDAHCNLGTPEHLRQSERFLMRMNP